MDNGHLDQDKRLIQALILKWRKAEREHAESEQLWQEKLETCLTAEDLGGDLPWKESEEAWFLKEQSFQIHAEGLLRSMERKQEEDSGECPDLYELQEQFCERRLHLEFCRSQWLQKDAWFQRGEASQNQIQFQKNRIFTLKAKITSLQHATICDKSVENALAESVDLSDKLEEEKAKLTLRESNLQEQLALKENALVQAQLDALNKDQQHILERLQWMQRDNARTNVFMDRFNNLSQRFGQPPPSEEEMWETQPHLKPTPLSQEGGVCYWIQPGGKSHRGDKR
uniref:Uncharacterized protein n=1 Tax=Knipowitschia caucasica TaxID=637954 RepID=A0AAV2KXR7_KNICA